MFGLHMMGEHFGNYSGQYKCFSVSMFPGGDKRKLEKGGKIILPPSALDMLTKLNVVYPMLFKLINTKTKSSTNCGVLEFVADEGHMYIPYWMMRNLLIDEGDELHIESVNLPVATFSRFEPQSPEFLEDISNPKAALEYALRNFACLTTDDVVAISYNDKVYEMRVLEVKPGGAASIIECDMSVDFAPAVGYEEPQRPNQNTPEEEEGSDVYEEDSRFLSFGGSGNRLDGKINTDAQQVKAKPRSTQVGIPDYDFEIGTIKFFRGDNTMKKESEPEKALFEAFTGSGAKLRLDKN